MKNQNEENIYLKLVTNSDNWMDAFRQNIGILRVHYGWSVRVLAEKADVSDNTINKIVQGKTNDCDMSIVVRLARAFNVSVDELIGASTIEPETRACVAKCRAMPWHFRNLARSYIRHIYTLWLKSKSPEVRLVITPECKRGHLQTTNITMTVDISHIPQSAIGRVAHGLLIPCDHYEPYFMQGEIILLAVDRDGQDGEMCVISHNGEYYIVRKKMYIVDGQKKWKYMSLFTNREFLKEDIEDKLGYVVGFLNADDEHSWGIR